MTPEEVRRAVPAGPRLDLDLTALPGVVDLVAGTFPGGRLVLDPVTARDEGAAALTVTGTGASGPFTGMAVTARFTPDGGGVTVTAEAVGPDGWTFATAFPVLTGSLFADVRFQRAELRLGPDLTFSGRLASTGTVLLDLLVADGHGDVTGQLEVVAGRDGTRVPALVLDGPSGITLDLGLFTLSEVGYQLRCEPVYAELFQDLRPRSTITLLGGVPITVGGVERRVDFGAELGPSADTLFWGNFAGLGALGLDDVARFVGGAAFPKPFGIDVGGTVKLTDVRALVRPSVPTVDFVSVTVETDVQWEVVPGLLTLEAVDLTFRVDQPLSGSPQVSGTVSGLFPIGDEGVLELGAGFGSPWIGGGLRAGDPPLRLPETVRHFLGDGHPEVPDLEVDRFDFTLRRPGDGRPTTYSGALEVSGDWEVTSGVVLTGLDIELTETSLLVHTGFSLDEVGLHLTAAHNTSGWTFEGGSQPDAVIPVGTFLTELAGMFGTVPVPAPLAGLLLHDLAVAYTSGTGRMTIGGAASFPVDTAELDLALSYDSAGPSYGAVLTATAGGFEAVFELRFEDDTTGSRWAAVYTHAAGPAPEVKEIVGAVVPSVAAYVPSGLRVDVEDAFVASDGTTHVFVIDLDATLDLSHLPVVGAHLDLGTTGFDPLRVIALTGALTEAEVTALNTLPIPALPVEDLPAGLSFAGHLKLGAFEAPVTLPVAGPPPPGPAPATPPTSTVTWRQVQRTFGPVAIDRVGIGFEQGARLTVLVDAAITAGGLTLSCDGLGASVSLTDPAAPPVFDLAGLGVSYTGGPVQVSGAFLKGTLAYQGTTVTAYGGKAVIRTEALTIGALGSYAQLPEGPSLFVYAFLDYPIGGPAFFFVEGLAAGFGYNRRFVAPPVTAIADFPLVAEAVGTLVPGTLGEEIERLQDSLPPSVGDYFLALGVRFTSFKMIDSFLLVTAGFGHRFELDVLGLSTLVVPTPDAAQAGATPVAEIQLALKASFVPDDGYFSLLAQLTPNSYLLSRSCRLTGGFAFVSWFGDDHTGDFVLSVGGYHPHFTVPDHYPSVPRLGFAWKVSDHLSLKGSAYYALTPGALMAGAALSAVYEDGSLRAWFDAGMDFLIAWQPYHYEAGLHLTVGASYTFSFFGRHTITAHVGTDVEFWGPDFGGRAHIDLDIISFTVDFGSQGGKKAEAVPWKRFRDAQLPAADKVVSVVLRGGAPQGASGNDLGTIDPGSLELVVDSAMPATGGRSGTADLAGTGAAFGIAPVGARPGSFTSIQTITLTRDGGKPAEALFQCAPVGRNLPAALWGEELTPSLGHAATRENLLTGYVVTPAPPLESAPLVVPVAEFAPTDLAVEHHAFTWTPQPVRAAAVDQTLDLTAGAAVRAAVAGALLPDLNLDLNGLSAADFLVAPEVLAGG
ncbi:hypothetical protein LO762_29645 [Actinocorallia sp. API 0066]|uniref:DUF6603 domain-containing protein n=1 Tax=Actinocorallia sp. API 0066 TaxID=2896846 RepID=UPI001E3E28AF|nr:DUF6603 domain-containing protein [Actinocorallia sp. API 0066]MCD0453314.1 hypothetical protein [Actinocorallia sp. API 0066]